MNRDMWESQKIMLRKECCGKRLREDDLDGIENTILEFCAHVLLVADKNDHPSDLADRLRSFKSQYKMSKSDLAIKAELGI